MLKSQFISQNIFQPTKLFCSGGGQCFLLAAWLVLLGAFSANAANILKLDDSLLLNDNTAWSGGVAPGSGDVAVFDSPDGTAYAATNTWSLGANASWLGVQVLSPTNSLTITNDGNSLVLGAAGFDLSIASNNFTFYPDISFSTPQVWNITNGRTLTIFGSLTGLAGTNALDILKINGGNLNVRSPGVVLRGNQTVIVSNNANAGTLNIFSPVSDGGNGYGITKSGAGTFSLRGTNTFTGPVTVNQGTLSLETNASTTAATVLTVNNPAGGTGGTFGSFTVNAGGQFNGQVVVRTNSTGSSINCTVNGTISGNVTTEAGSGPASPNANATPAVGTGFVNVNGGGSLSASGFITNNGQVKFSGTAPVAFGTFVMTNGLGGIWDANQSAKTFTFPNGSQLSYFKCDSNQVATLQVAGNGSASIRWFGYNDGGSGANQLYSYTNTINGGNWTIGNIGQNNTSAHYVGLATITGGASVTITNNIQYSHGTWNVINGTLRFAQASTFLAQNHQANAFGLNISVNSSGGGSSTLYAGASGYQIGQATAGANSQANSSLNIGNGGTAYITNNLQIGVATANTESDQLILGNGGKLWVSSTISSASTGVNGRTCGLFWNGGQITAATITPGVGFNDPLSSINTTTISNTAGILSPGDNGIPGRTLINGSYVQTGAGSLFMDISGVNQGNAFTNASGSYDFVSCTGSATVSGLINANLIYGYVPPAGTTKFTVLTGTGGLVANSSALGYNGFVPVYTNGVLFGGKYFQALVSGNNIILTNYGVIAPALSAKFTPTNAVGVAPTTPTFTDISTGVITNRVWDFGDTSTLSTTATSVSHTYPSVGTYTVTLTVYGIDGSTSTTTGTVNATLPADQAVWKGGLAGNAWDTVTANWFTNGFVGTYHDPDIVTFDDSGNAATPVNLTAIRQPQSVTFSNVTKNYTLSGVGYISGNASLTLAGDGFSGGTVTVLTTNNFTGPTTVSVGTLQIGNGVSDGSIDTSSAITNYGSLVFNQSGTHSLAAGLTGSGSLLKSGTGTLILAGDNSATYTGNVTINGGTLAVTADSTLGQSFGNLTVSNAALQVSSASTLNRNLTIGGTNVSLNPIGSLILPNAITGVAPVTIGGSGTLQVDNGGSSVSLPTNIVLNGGSVAYARNDNYSQPGTITGNSVSSIIDNLGANSGTTNTLKFAGGFNSFAAILTETNSSLVLTAAAASTNVIGGADLTGGGAFGPRGPSCQFAVSSGTYLITNSTLFGTVGGGFQASDTFVVNGGSVIASWYGANTAATDGGLHFFRCNLQIDSGLLYTKVWGAGMAPGFAAAFNMNGGTFLLDDSGTLPGATAATTFFGLALGNHINAGVPDRFSGDITATQTGGSIILAASTNNNVELGGANNSPTNHTAIYTIKGGSLAAIGGANGGNIKIGGSADGASTALLTLTNSGKIIISGAIQGYAGAAGSQAFTFGGGTLAAGGVNMTSLADAIGSSTGTLVNNGGVLSPGDAGVAGRTTVTGNYSAASSASLRIDLNGSASATAFTNSGAFYDNVVITGTAALNGSLIVATNGYVPGATSSFTILTASGGISGGFNNLVAGRVTVVGSTNTFAVVQTPTSVILTNFSGVSSGPTLPASISSSFNGSQLVLTWPTGQGWVLESQTNSRTIGLSNNWVRMPSASSPFTNAVNPTTGTVFYRLTYP